MLSASAPKSGFTNFNLTSLLSFVLTIVMLITMLMSAYVFIELSDGKENDSIVNSTLSDIAIISQDLTTNAGEAIKGNPGAFKEIKSGILNIQDNLYVLNNGNSQKGLPSIAQIAPSVSSKLLALNGIWSAQEELINDVLTAQDAIIRTSVNKIKVRSLLPYLLELADEVSGNLQRDNAPEDHIYSSAKNLALLQRIATAMNSISENETETALAADQFMRDAATFNSSYQAIIKESGSWKADEVSKKATLKKVDEMKVKFDAIALLVADTLKNSTNMFASSGAADELYADRNSITSTINDLQREYSLSIDTRILNVNTALALGGTSVLLLVFIFVVNNVSERKKLKLIKETSERIEFEKKETQEAIKTLLIEMEPFSDGDLTSFTTVTEGVTGAMADSFNLAITDISDLVRRINVIAVQVSTSTAETVTTTKHLASASSDQSKMISDTSSVINQMSDSVDQVTKKAEESNAVAQLAVKHSKKGATAVSDTIKGMDVIRETIQETSKRIKRLGESSQEISESIENIDEIADQINILALNASIQAATAGESGKGFAVVAAEVQKLAEKTNSATKKIKSHVKTIQSDTNEAVSSMESSTKQVVNGSRLASNAGEALREIESASVSVANYVSMIASESKQQSKNAELVSGEMHKIARISVETAEGAKDTATSIAGVSNLSSELQASVQRFKLD